MSKLTMSVLNGVYDKAVKEFNEFLNSDEFDKALWLHYREVVNQRLEDGGYKDDEVESVYRWQEARRRTLDSFGIPRSHGAHYAGLKAVLDKYPRWIYYAWQKDRIHDPRIQRR